MNRQLKVIRSECHQNFLKDNDNTSNKYKPIDNKNNREENKNDKNKNKNKNKHLKKNNDRAINQDNNNVKKSVTCIIGDSMLKDIKGWQLNKSLNKDFVVVKSFSGATTDCMEHYVKPTLTMQPNNIILHVGTNDLKSEATASKIAKKIFNIAKICHSESNAKITVSGIILRDDNLNDKAKAVNDILQKKCNNSNSIDFLDHSNIDNTLLNHSKLHLNKFGTKKFAKNLINRIQNN